MSRLERKEELLASYEERRNKAQFDSAQARWEHGDVDGGKNDLVHLLERRPDHRQARLLLAEIYLSQDNMLQAEQEIDQALKYWPHDQESLDAKQAFEELRRTAAKRPEGFPTRSKLLQSDRSKSPVEGAKDESRPSSRTVGHIESLPEVSPPGESGDQGSLSRSDSTPLARAIEALQSNQPEQAVQILQPVVKDQPENTTLQRTLAVAHYRSGDPSAAQIVLQQALSLDNRDALSYFLLGCVLENQGKSDAAEEHFLKASRLNRRFASSALRQ